jgi:hypothetical protein
MYKENEILEVLGDIKEGDKIKIPKGSKVRFIKAFGSGPKSLVQVEFEGKVYALNELAVRPTETDPLEVLKSLNAALVKNNPNLGIYHHNVFIRTFYKVKAFILGLFSKKKVAPKDDNHIKELKKLISNDEDFLDNLED